MTFVNREKRILPVACFAEDAFARRAPPTPRFFVNVVILWHLFRRLGKRCHSIGLRECVAVAFVGFAPRLPSYAHYKDKARPDCLIRGGQACALPKAYIYFIARVKQSIPFRLMRGVVPDTEKAMRRLLRLRGHGTCCAATPHTPARAKPARDGDPGFAQNDKAVSWGAGSQGTRRKAPGLPTYVRRTT